MPVAKRRVLQSECICLLCAGYGTRLKGEPTISNYGSQGKSQAQTDGGEGHNVITTWVSADWAPEGSVIILNCELHFSLFTILHYSSFDPYVASLYNLLK